MGRIHIFDRFYVKYERRCKGRQGILGLSYNGFMINDDTANLRMCYTLPAVIVIPPDAFTLSLDIPKVRAIVRGYKSRTRIPQRSNFQGRLDINYHPEGRPALSLRTGFKLVHALDAYNKVLAIYHNKCGVAQNFRVMRPQIGDERQVLSPKPGFNEVVAYQLERLVFEMIAEWPGYNLALLPFKICETDFEKVQKTAEHLASLKLIELDTQAPKGSLRFWLIWLGYYWGVDGSVDNPEQRIREKDAEECDEARRNRRWVG